MERGYDVPERSLLGEPLPGKLYSRNRAACITWRVGAAGAALVGVFATLGFLAQVLRQSGMHTGMRASRTAARLDATHVGVP